MYMHTSTPQFETDFLTEPRVLPKNNVFLFVSQNLADLGEYLEHFPKSRTVNSLAEAQQNIDPDNLPEMIVLDIPHNHFQLVGFKVWLTLNHLTKIPIIYNESALKREDVRQLFVQGLVDDVVALHSNYTRLPYKARFIGKVHLSKQQNNIAETSKQDFGLAKQFVMRSLDVVVSLIALVALLPVFLIIAIAIKWESPGPVFYVSLRAGRGFKVFRFFKFRTMITDADKIIDKLSGLNVYSAGPKTPHFFKVINDPRITKIGSFLRNTSLDELPQLFNVLKGDMSMVGNRPLPLYEATTLTTNEWAERFMAPAGITGLWQISKRGNAEMSNEERILLDINYARHRSLRGDLKILLKTPSALIQKANV